MWIQWDFSLLPLREPTGIFYTVECVLLLPGWCMLMREKLINSDSQCWLLVQRMEIPKVWWPLVRWQLSSWVSHVRATVRSSTSMSCSPDPHHLCRSPPPLSFPSLATAPSICLWSLKFLRLSPTVPVETTCSPSGGDDGSEEGRAR